jgi:hypothetical protein
MMSFPHAFGRRQHVAFVLAGAALVALIGWRLSRPSPADAFMILASGPSAPLLASASITSTATPASTAARSSAPDSEGALSALPPVVIPPQCWTSTRDASKRVHNPCFVCHMRGAEPNYTDDSDLQTHYDFARSDRKNPYTNLFVDRQPAIAKISDDQIGRWVREDNYPPKLPGTFAGYRPDAAFSFDDRGFDRTNEGAYTGWRAYAYTPLPGSFFATNGSMDDALIRLPEPYRQDVAGAFDREIYEINLAIVEALVRRSDVPIAPVSEAKLGLDLDGDGRVGEARRVAFLHSPHEGRTMRWVGRAATLHAEGRAPIAPGLFPLGTEFLHSVRYLDVAEGVTVVMARRMKELRYARKTSWLTYGELQQRVREEDLEKLKHRDRARVVMPAVAAPDANAAADRGVSNGRGWRYQGFIEDARGALRAQTFRESAACAGCHGGLGVTTDGTFSFARKLPVTAFRAGWFHPSQRSLVGVPEPRRADGTFEYTHYLEQNGAGDELRANEEIASRFFDARGELVPTEVDKLHRDVTRLLMPSASRALALDKAYLLVVREQSFEKGRDAMLRPATTVHAEVPEDEAPTELTKVAEPVAAPAFAPKQR